LTDEHSLPLKSGFPQDPGQTKLHPVEVAIGLRP
jgi:hypothetical protein